jgi:hypothetical protein
MKNKDMMVTQLDSIQYLSNTNAEDLLHHPAQFVIAAANGCRYGHTLCLPHVVV